MSDTWRSAWQAVRSRRSVVWGRASEDEARQATYSSALEQAEQFARAADAVGVPTRPVLLFYALGQGLRSVAADSAAAPWEISGHGAGVKQPPASGCIVDRILDTVVTPHKSITTTLRIASKATASPVPVGPITVRNLWESLPEAAPLGREAGIQNPSLPFKAEATGRDASGALSASASLVALMTQARFYVSDPELETTLDGYPLGAGYEIRELTTPSGESVKAVVWPDPAADFGFKFLGDVGYTWNEEHYHLRAPLVAGGDTTPSGLMTWWALLLALSSIARYHPATWREALDPDASPLAVPIEKVLELAQMRVPKLLDAALSTPRALAMRAAMRGASAPPRKYR